MAMQTSRERAEEFLNTLQTRARDAWAHLDDTPLGREEVRQRVGLVVRRAKAQSRRLERQARAQWARVSDRVPSLARTEIEKLGKHARSVNRKFGRLAQRFSGSASSSS